MHKGSVDTSSKQYELSNEEDGIKETNITEHAREKQLLLLLLNKPIPNIMEIIIL